MAKKENWENISLEQLTAFFSEVKSDYQFDKNSENYKGFLNMEPSSLPEEYFDVVLYIVNCVSKAEVIANFFGLTISSASLEELIISEQNQTKIK